MIGRENINSSRALGYNASNKSTYIIFFEIKQRDKLVKMIYLRVVFVIKNLSTSTETILIPMIRLL